MEINGKSSKFSRPVLILKKFSRYGFMAIPLTSQLHEGSWYIRFIFQGKIEVAVVSQAKSMSVRRLYDKIGQIPNTDLALVRRGFLELFGEND